MSDDNKKIARRLVEEGWNKGHEEVIHELMSAKCRFHDPVFPSLTTGAENYKEHIRNCRSGFPDLKITIEDSIAERNEVVHHWKAHGTHRGAFLGMPATNKGATVSGTTIYRMERGKVAEVWADWNLMSMLEQLGLAAKPQPQAPEQQPAAAKR
jgi:steroid delta-isomerase-like uncharacterized protein